MLSVTNQAINPDCVLSMTPYAWPYWQMNSRKPNRKLSLARHHNPDARAYSGLGVSNLKGTE